MFNLGDYLQPMVAAVILGAAVGCGPSGPSTTGVSGTVTYRGEAVEGATVSFTPVSEGGQSAVGTTDAAGHYELTTFERGDGALAGDYKVRVFKYDSAAKGPEEVVADEDYVPPSETDRPPPAPKHVLPEDYAYDSRTPLQFTVEPGSDSVFDITID